MPSHPRLLIAAVFVLLLPSTSAGAQGHPQPIAMNSATPDSMPHPLSWWTENALRFSPQGELGQEAALHYVARSKVTRIGTLSGHAILQVVTSVSPKRPAVSYRADTAGLQWKSLLIQAFGDASSYVEIYRAVADYGPGNLPFRSAAIYGAGPNAILATYDPIPGNGALCTNGYWWFDSAGAHPVDFSPLLHAINRAVPKGSLYPSDCWALQPARSELNSSAQRGDAQCHACGWLGQIHARYRIDHGQALPVTVRYTAPK